MRWASALLVALLLTACSPRDAATPTPYTLHIAGSTSMVPVLTELARAYQEQHPSVLVEIQSIGSGAGMSELQSNRADLAATSWLPPQAPAIEGVEIISVARDAIAIIVHRENPLGSVGLLQVRSIYRGETLGWEALGGRQNPVLVVSREEGSGTRAGFEAMVMGGEHVTLNAIVMPSSAAVVSYVGSHRDAIGYVSASATNDQVRALRVEGVPASPDTVRSGAYHLSRVLGLVANQPVSGEAAAFNEFVLSPAGRAIVARYHVPLR